MDKVIALIPCYNVAQFCKPVIEKTLQYVSKIILIDDGSTDNTKEVLQTLVKQFPEKIHLITFPQNQGKGIALSKGIQYAVNNLPFDTIVTLDSDGQHLPEEIEKLTHCIGEKTPFVIGVRAFEQMPFKSRFANTIISFLLKRIFPSAPIDNQSGFRAFSKPFAEKIDAQVTGSRYEMEFRCILLALKDRDAIVQCPITTIYLYKNQFSHFSKIKDSYRILCVLFHFWRTRSL